MRRHNNLMLVLSLMILSGSLNACRDVGQMMGSRDAQLQTGQWWAGPIPDATPVKPDDRTAWISYKNVTQEQSYDLRSQLREGLVAQGYKIIDDPDQANFHVFYTLRFFGENPSLDGGKNNAAGLGGITGGVGGAAYAGGRRNAAAASPMGDAISNYSQVIEYDVIMDVRIAQRKKGIVKHTISGAQRDRQVSAAGGSTPGGIVAGGRSTTLDNRQQVQEEDNMLWQENRLVLWARQIRLTPEEAKPKLERALVSALPQLLP
jgi:hypothetical protein